ncbi:MAG TPA: MurT ligase domain-containing protein [Chloroflexia bacterium]|nr:MurT ligase domain-containing protein [Chloroflexia bacterium]
MRQTFAIATGKTLLEILHRTGRGGTAFPGLVATKLDPHILRGLTARLPAGSAMVIGTNGKTTTTRLLATILNRAGLKIANNRSGSNLIRGLTSTLLGQASVTGRLEADMGLFEVDEAAFPQAQREISPRLILVNNLFRDQLDRYGEIDTVRRRWAESFKQLTPGTTLVLNADDPSLAYLARFAPEGVKVVFFGVNSPAQVQPELAHAADAAKCILCGADLVYDAIYISHMGHYYCPNGDFARPTPQYVAREIKLNGTQGSQFVLETPQGQLALELGVPGLYNVYNATGAATAALSLGISERHILQGLAEFKSAFGRIERVALDEGKELLLALVKNPVGFNEVLRMLTTDPAKRLKMLVIINDLYADGRDVSWLWDVDFEILEGRVEWVSTSGLRATDMANRLKYAGLQPDLLSWNEDIGAALQSTIQHMQPGETLYITPTYTAMLQLREILQKMGLVVPFWEE